MPYRSDSRGYRGSDYDSQAPDPDSGWGTARNPVDDGGWPDGDGWARARPASGRGASSRGAYSRGRGPAGPARRGSRGRRPDERRQRARSGAGRGRGRPPAGRTMRYWRGLRPVTKAAYVGGAIVTVLVVVAALAFYSIYRQLGGNMKVVTVNGLTHRSVYGAQNILVLGSQTRKGQKGSFGMAAGQAKYTSNSDNLLMVHLDPTHTHAIVLSIPRDTMVYEPACKARIPQIGIGMQGPYSSTIIDGALNIGGPSCAVATVADLTGVKFDHFVEFDFNSFRAMVDAIGGVEVCAPPGGYHDPYSHLSLSAGKHLLSYNQALAYVRTRHGVSAEGDTGGDLPRIMLQQAFLSSVIQKVNSQGILDNLSELLKIANVATKALTVDQGLSNTSELLGLAKSLIHLHASNVTLLTMPTIFDPADVNRLLPEEPQADVLFQMVESGQSWHGSLPTMAARKVKVRVLNGTGQGGLAATTATQLRALGYDVTGVGNAPYTSATTIEYSGTAQADAAYTLMGALKSTPVAQNLLQEPTPQTGHAGTISLVIGADWAGVNPPRTPRPARTGAHQKHRASKATQPSPSPSASFGSAGFVQSRNAGASICSGLPLANSNPGTPP